MPEGGRKLDVRVCAFLYREAKAVLGSGEFDDARLVPFLYDCGRPLHEGAGAPWAEAEGQPDTLVILGGCALVRQASNDHARCRFLSQPQCAYHFLNARIVDDEQARGAYVMTTGWLSSWKVRLKRWGFDRPTARAFFGESAKSLLLLDTGVDPDSSRRLAEFSEYLGLPARTLPVGIEHFRLELEAALLGWRMSAKSESDARALEGMKSKFADQAMAIDLISGLTHMKNESETIAQIMALTDMLFAPKRTVYAEIADGAVRAVRASAPPEPEVAECASWAEGPEDEPEAPGTSGCVRMRFSFQDRLLGVMEMRELAFPEKLGMYAETVRSVSKVCGLALANARMYEEVHELAIHDSLTGLSTRRHFFTLGEKEFARAKRYGRPLSLLMVDIDFFKRVNDTLGHIAGDEILKGVARICRSGLRVIDVAGRYGGEEFVILLPETGFEYALSTAERLRSSVEAWMPEVAARVTISIGAAFGDESCPDLETLIDRSDRALYRAKEAGRNRIEAWRPES